MGNRHEAGFSALETPLVTTVLIKRVILILSLTALFILIFLALWYLPDAFLIVFAGILLGIFLSGIAAFLSDHIGVARHWSLTLVIILFFMALIGLGWLFGPLSTMVLINAIRARRIGRAGCRLSETECAGAGR